MTTKNNISAGYKDSAVGVVPKDWKVYDFRDIASISKEKYTPSDSSCMPCVELEHISQGDGVLLGSTEARLQKSTKNVFKKGCVLFGKLRPYLRKYLHVDFDGVCSSEIWVLSANENICSNEYLYRLVSSDKYIQCANVSIGSKMPRADWNFVSITPFPVPPMEEQRKIAEILGVWDEAIEKQSRLIEKLELRKRALMQRLLTGRTRLPGFIDDVQYKKLKPFIVEKSERNTNQTYTNVLSVTNNRGFINQAEQFDREVASDNTANYKLVHRGQFAYNPSRVNVGSLDLLQTYDLGILSPMYIVFETRPTMDPKFLYYQLKSGWFVGHIPMYVQGSVRDSLSFDGLENMKFWIPSLTEQKAIAEVLITADDEIATHRKKLDALRLQKRGLMQQLLTGKTRVKI